MPRKQLGWSKETPRRLDLSSWNALGRAVAENDSLELSAFHEGRKDEPSLLPDPRSAEMAEAVLAELVRLNAEGRASDARAVFDPAHAPFAHVLEKGVRGLTFCAILGPMEFLVQQGTHYTKNTTWHIQGERIAEANPLAGFTWSRNHLHFLAVQPDGAITLHHAYGAPPYDLIPALPGAAFVPTDLPQPFRTQYQAPADRAAYTHLAISDDGRKILLCDAERGIAILTKAKSHWNVQLLFPSMTFGLEEQLRKQIDEDSEFQLSFAMMHAALSPDGRYVALGTQGDGHYLIDLDGPNGPHLHAKLGHLSEYPHDACFSNDSTHVALNSCHFYNGVTFAAEMQAVRGLTTQPYDMDTRQTILNTYLRVYASGCLSASMVREETGAFLLAGGGFASCVTPNGRLLWELGFGSSAGGVDVCANSQRVLIAAHSGMLHLLDPKQPQDPLIFSGYKAPQELHRWLFWDRLEHPLLW